jgi:HEPN domain-containing protein
MKLHEEWLFKSENDLKSAIVLLAADEPIFDISICHSQQCAGKALSQNS